MVDHATKRLDGIDQWSETLDIPGIAMTFITREQLVAAFAAQNDLDVLRCELGRVPGGYGGHVGKGFVIATLHLRQDVHRLFGLERQYDMLAAEVMRDLCGGCSLVNFSTWITDRERL